MKKVIINILVAFTAGIFGAYIFNLLSHQEENTNKQSYLIPENGKVRKVKKDKYFNSDTDFAKAASLSTQSVVYIKTISAGNENLSIFDLYFGDGFGGRRRIGSGSGVIFTTDGYIVTNNHVIEGAEEIEVVHQKRTYKAKVVGTDPSADIAIIKIEGKNLPNIQIGSSKSLNVGEWVIAVGNPFNLKSTVTAGIVSAKGRDIQLLEGRFPLESFIQTDAAINPGNSGGALVDIEGKLVGINTAILSRTGSYTGYGFAVPVDIVSKIFNDLIQYGEVQKAFTGLEVIDLDTEIAQEYNLNEENLQGVLVKEVLEDSQAEKIGIKKGDIILKINGEKIDRKSNYEEQLSYYRPNDKLKITYRRGKKEQEAQILLTNREGTTSVLKSQVYNSETLGANLEPVSKVEKDKLEIDSGVKVKQVRSGLFKKLGISDGFIILAINRTKVYKPKEVEDILSNVSGRIYIEGINKRGQRGYYQFFY